MNISNKATKSPMEALSEWSASYTNILRDSGGGDLDQFELIDDDWDTRFLFLATHYYLFVLLGAFDESTSLARQPILPLYANLIMNTRTMLIQFGFASEEATAVVPNFYIRQYDYLIHLVGGDGDYRDRVLDEQVVAKWFSTSASDFVESRSYLESQPKTRGEFLKRGNARRSSGDYKAAIEDYTKVIEIDSTDGEAYAYRAISYELLEDYESARKDYEFSLRHNPNNVEVLKLSALNKFTLGDASGAIDDYSRAIKLTPEDFELYLKRANASELGTFCEEGPALEQLSKAIEDYQKALEICNENSASQMGLIRTYEKRADICMQQSMYSEAISDYDKSISACATRKLYLKRADAKRLVGDLEGACNDWRSILEVERSKYDTDEEVNVDIQKALKYLDDYSPA